MLAIMQGKDFNRLVEATKGFTVASGGNPMFSWIRLEFSKIAQNVRAVAVDGFTFAVEHSMCKSVDEDFAAYIKPNMKKVSNKNKISIYTEGKKLFIKDNEFITGFEQPDGEFFHYRQLLDDLNSRDNQYKISFNAELLIKTLTSAKAGSTGGVLMPVILEFAGESEAIVLRTGGENIKMILPMRID